MPLGGARRLFGMTKPRFSRLDWRFFKLNSGEVERATDPGHGTAPKIGLLGGLFLRFAALLFRTFALTFRLLGLASSEPEGLAHRVEFRLFALMQLVFLACLKIDHFIVHIEMLAPKLTIMSDFKDAKEYGSVIRNLISQGKFLF